MKTVILAGGMGTRLSEETVLRPKPMIEIGGRPILWHIMNIYAAHGHREFLVALGYKGEIIKQYFLDFHAMTSDLSIDLSTGATTIHGRVEAPWKVHLAETGLKTQTGGRLRRLRSWLQDDPCFMLTYGDGVADVDITALVNFHAAHGKLATVTAVRPPSRFGNLDIAENGDGVRCFTEKSQAGEGWINGGFFVLDRRVLDYIENDETVWELSPLERLASEGELCAFRHGGFWSPMDVLREKQQLESLWNSGHAPWKVW